MFKVVCASLICLALSSCQTKEVTEMSYAEVKALASQKEKECQAQGVKSGTSEMSVCVKHEVNREQAIRSKNNARRQAALNEPDICQGFGDTAVCF